MPTAPPSPPNTFTTTDGGTARTPEDVAAYLQKVYDARAEDSDAPPGLQLHIRYAPEHTFDDGRVPFHVGITGDGYAGPIEVYMGLTPCQVSDPDAAETELRFAYLNILKRSEKLTNRLHAASQTEG